MGSGSSKVGSGRPSSFPEAFAPGKDFVAVGGANHQSRTVSRTTQAEWGAYASQFGKDLPSSEEAKLYKEWDSRTGNLYGYFRTTNAMALNAQFYQNPGKTPDEIFSKRTKQGKKDLETVKALDDAINTHTTPSDGTYYRFCNPDSLKRSYGLSDSDMQMIMQAPKMSQAQLDTLSGALKGSKSSNAGYTSVSANRSLNAFSDPNAKQSKGYTIERRISVKKGTNAYAPKKNAQESEVVFGRGFDTKLSHITVEGDHIVIHETH